MITPLWYTYEFDLLKTHKALQEEILRDIARRIAETNMNITETAAWQAEMAQKSGILYDDIIEEITKRTGGTAAEIRQIFKDAKVEVFNYDTEMLLDNGQSPEAVKYISPKMMNTMKAALTKTATEAKNLTKTTAITSQTAYLQACDLAHQKVVSGAFSYQSAVKTAVKFAAKQGVKVIYPSGHISSLDVAIRRSVLTGVNQTAGNLQNMRANELECDIMEISAHSGARPSHAEWQGKLVSRSGAKGYLSLDDIGYGEVTGFMGANCRHNWYMYFGGMRMYTPEELDNMNNRTATYNDEEYSEYDALQIQRKFERDIRRYKSELVMYDEAMKIAEGDVSELKTEFNFTAQKLKSKENELKDFCEQTSLRRDRYREQVFAVKTEKNIANFGRSTSGKAVWADRAEYTKFAKAVSLNMEGLPESIDKYREIKYNNKEEYKRLQKYFNCVQRGEISPLAGYSAYKKTALEIEEKLIGITAKDGTVIKDYSAHFVSRTIGHSALNEKYNRAGVSVDEIKDALVNGELGKIQTDSSGNVSRLFQGDTCKVSVNINTGNLVQTNKR